MSSKEMETDAKGIPLKGPNPEGVPVWLMYSTMNAIFGAIGLAIAWFWVYSTAKQDGANQRMYVIAKYDFVWLYLGILSLRFLQLPLYMALGATRGASKVHVPDQHVYKVMGAEGSKLGYVLMETEGEHGDFNRAQRAWQNYLEQFGTLVLYYVAASWVFPFESFICVLLWGISRVVGASGYKSSADGRLLGTLLGAIPFNVLQGMLLIVIFTISGE